ncbi:MAG: LysM peptidoglycan-binding domain-containing protein [Firmicutes bacterium]|nr:LysM peptidoglycan-binding domain-containing protein [Bacillota bacterium]
MRKSVKLVLLVLLVSTLIQVNVAYADQVHRVKSGETLYLVGKQYGVTVEEILANNKYLRTPSNLFVNQVLIIPEPKPEPSNSNTYQVQSGESLYIISNKLGVSMEALAAENNLSNWNEIYPGQVLSIPSEKVSQPAPKPKPNTYQVKYGDSLYKVSQEHGVSIDALAAANGLNSWDYLYVGQELTIPQPVYQAPPNYVEEFKGTFFRQGSSYTNKIALTFDDGPDSAYTDQVLDVLQKYSVPSTFFLMGERASQYPWIVNRMQNEGHVVASHSWSHPNLAKISEQSRQSEVLDTENSIYQITGKRTGLIRPPYGAVNSEMLQDMKDLNYKVINWSVDTVDWKEANDVNQILINALPNVKGGSIILFHSAGGGQDLSDTVSVLPELIYTLRVQGYEFVTVNELLSIPAYK